MAQDRTSQSWRILFDQTMAEPDPAKLPKRVAAVETAIYERLQILVGDSETQGERQDLEQAVNQLRLLKRDRLHYPDWEH